LGNYDDALNSQQQLDQTLEFWTRWSIAPSPSSGTGQLGVRLLQQHLGRARLRKAMSINGYQTLIEHWNGSMEHFTAQSGRCATGPTFLSATALAAKCTSSSWQYCRHEWHSKPSSNTGTAAAGVVKAVPVQVWQNPH